MGDQDHSPTLNQLRVNQRNRPIASVDERRTDVGLLEYKAVLHHRDIVEEIATQRHGEIDAIDQYISDGKHWWRVRFLDGREPALQYFLNEEHLRLIRCPHEGQ